MRCRECVKHSVCESCKGWYCQKCVELPSGTYRTDVDWLRAVRWSCHDCGEICIDYNRKVPSKCDKCDMHFCSSQ